MSSETEGTKGTDADEDAGDGSADYGDRPATKGPDLVREALDRARADGAARRAEAARADRTADSAAARGRRASRRVLRNGGDPVTFGSAVEALVSDRGWEREVASGSVLGSWATIVGDEVARHAEPVSLVAGVLTVQAESTAWATQLRLLSAQLMQRLGAAGGPEVVTRLVVRGPTGPSWSRGPLRVKGEGPRDTYG